MKKIFFIIYFATFSTYLFAQVGIGTVTPDASSALEISASDKGILIPQVALGDVADTMLDGTNTAATGLLIYNTNAGTTGGSGVGYYYFNGTTWERLTTSATSDDDIDWYEEGTITSPNDITDDIFTQGNVAIGKTTADYLLDISTTTETRGINTLVSGSTSGFIFGSYIENSNTGNGSHYGSYNFLDGAGTGDQTGAANVVSNTGNGLHYGIYNLINNSGTGNHYAAYNEIAGGNAATGSQYGSYQSINNSATNNQYASYNRIWGNGDGNHYGAYQTIENNGDGEHYGAFNNLIGSGTGSQIGMETDITNSGAGWHIGVRNNLSGTSATGNTEGVFNNISRGGSGSVTGVRNDITNATSTGVKTGVATIITGSGGTKSGITNSVSGTTTATQAGVRNTISTSSNNIQYGVNNQVSALTGNNSNTFGTFNVVEGEGNGAHYGTYSSLSGTGTGEQYGSYNEILNNGNNDHFGTYNELRGSGMGDHYGSGTYITGAGTGNQFGVRNEIINSGDGMHYGTYSNLTGTGTGNKYGIYTSINTAAGGDHYGVYSEVLKVGSYAGYYLGDVSIGTTIANNYILPSSRGAANQIMKTDGLGNVGWTSPALGDLSTVTASNGLYYDSAASRIKLGGMLTENTDISQNNFNMTFILDGASDIVVQNSINTPLFQVESTGESYFANNSLWRVGNAITGTIFAQISDNSDDGRFILYENGVASIDLDANSQFIFNEQGLDRNFRIESDSNSDMFFVDAGLNRVGIGTATPVDRFEVNGGRVEFTAITDASGTAGTGVLEIANALRIDGNEIITNTNTRLHLQHDNNGDFYVDNTTFFVDASTNRVGIGTDTPAYQLQLSTDSAAKPTSASWTVASDSKLKNNILPFTDGLELIKKINTVWFTYNGKAGMPVETGVGTVAQEFQKIAPYMVKPWTYSNESGANETYLGIDYGPLNFVMVNAIQEQQVEIETLKAKLENQQKEINEIKALLKNQ